MPCLQAKTMTFKVLEIDPNGIRHDLGKRFTVSIEESNQLYYQSTINPNSILHFMMVKLFKFTGPNGYQLEWIKTLETGIVRWRGEHFYIERVL